MKHFSLRILGVVLAGVVGIAETSPAQYPNLRLTVHPREMATATRTAQAGLQTLDGKPMAPLKLNSCESLLQFLSTCIEIVDTPMIYVPPQCVGTRRCPLVVMSNSPPEFYHQIADRYGMLAANVPGVKNGVGEAGVASVSRDIQTILQTFAVDPDKIAIAGRCGTEWQTLTYGAQNFDVFSRIAVGTAFYQFNDGDSISPPPPARAPNQTTEYYISAEILESNDTDFWALHRLRDLGYPVKFTLQFRAHWHEYEDYDFIGHWLQESWAIPDPTARPAPYAFSDPPPLTAEILAKMTTFWARFQKEPDSIRTTARRALVREVVLPVGKERVSTLMVDMTALATEYPSVTAALQAAQLTPQQHDVYRAALAGTRIHQNAITTAAERYKIGADSLSSSLGIGPTSVAAKNLEFMTAHPDEFMALEDTKMWNTP